MSLVIYNQKRNFKQTPEPRGKITTGNKFRFVIQRHIASRLHYDFRLELGGVLKSWAVPKGPSLNPGVKRFAIMVEDHPVAYLEFKGSIPAENYGAGEMTIWDKGLFRPVNASHDPITEKEALKGIKAGELKFLMAGEKINGEFVLIRLKNDERNWLLIKHKDQYAVTREYDAEKERTRSASSNRSIAIRKKAVPAKTSLSPKKVRVAKKQAVASKFSVPKKGKLAKQGNAVKKISRARSGS